MTTTRRKSYVSKPSFQIKLTIIFMLMVTIVANLVGGLCYLLISDKVQAVLEEHQELFSEITMREIAQFLIPKILLAEGISLCVVFILSILVTHTIAGPVYRLERVASEIAKGDLSIHTKLRPKDELKDLADAFNGMSKGLADRIRSLREEVEDLEQSCSAKIDFGRVKRVLWAFRLPEDEEPGEEDDGYEDDSYADDSYADEPYEDEIDEEIDEEIEDEIEDELVEDESDEEGFDGDTDEGIEEKAEDEAQEKADEEAEAEKEMVSPPPSKKKPPRKGKKGKGA